MAGTPEPEKQMAREDEIVDALKDIAYQLAALISAVDALTYATTQKVESSTPSGKIRGEVSQ